MVVNNKVNIIIQAIDKATAPIKKMSDSISGFASRNQATFQKMTFWGVAVFGALSVAINKWKQDLNEYENVSVRLSQILKTATGATDDQVNSLLDQAEALEKVWVASKENIINAQAQLATFDLQSDTIKKLIPSITDYVMAEKWATATTDDFKQMTNGLAQALNWNFSSLTRVWFVLDDTTKELISSWTEMERAEAIAKILDWTYWWFNQRLTETADWIAILRDREIWTLNQNLASWLMPIMNDLNKIFIEVLWKINTWMTNNPELTQTIIKVTLAITWIITVLWTLWLVIPIITAWFTSFAVAIKWVSTALIFLTTNPIWLTILWIAALVTGIVLLVKNWDIVKEKAGELWSKFMELYEKYKILFLPLIPLIETWKLLVNNWDLIKEAAWILKDVMINIWNNLWDTITDKMWIATDWLLDKFQWLKDFIEDIIWFATGAFDRVKKIWENAKNIASSIWEKVSNAVTWQRAVWWAVTGWKTYLVWERWPELFTPSTTWSIIANKNLWTSSWTSININMWWVSVNNSADEDRLVEKIKNELTRTLQLQKYSIS